MRHLPILVIILSIACGQAEDNAEVIRDTEKAFMIMAADSGIGPAFVHFADDSAVINRGNVLIKGKDAIKTYFSEGTQFSYEELQWTPENIDISQGLASTYGTYQYIYEKDSGMRDTAEGYFHTVWKKQQDGSWKYIWD